MPKKTSFITVADDGAIEHPEGSNRVSYRERSAESSSIAELALRLVNMKPPLLATMPLPPELAQAVTQCQGFRKNARVRQLRLIAKLLRQDDHEALRVAVDQVLQHKGAQSRREKSYSAWRERLLTEGDTAFGEFLALYRDADAQRLRQLVRVATRDPTSAKGKHAARELFRLIRNLGEAEAEAKADAAGAEVEAEAVQDAPPSDDDVPAPDDGSTDEPNDD